MLLQQHQDGSHQTISFYKFNYTDLKDRPTLHVKRSLFAATMAKMHAFVALFRTKNFARKTPLLFS